MLGKLIKYDLKALSRYMLPIFALSLISAVILRIDLTVQNNIGENFVTNTINFISIFLFVLAIVALSIGSFVVYIIYFYKSTLGEQGYFYMTLPATADEYLWAKFLSGAIVVLATAVVSISSGGLIILFSPECKEIIKMITTAMSEFFSQEIFGSYWILFTIYFVLSLFASQFMVAFCILSGQLLGKKKILGAFLAYIVLQVIEGFFGQIALLIGIGSSDLFTLSAPEPNFTAFGNLFTKIGVISIISSVLLMAFEYFVARYFLTKKLNLE